MPAKFTRYIAVGTIAALTFSVALMAQEKPAKSDEAKQQVDPEIRDYLSGNGLLNRGLYELASKEYRKFLEAHADHAKAPLARYGLGVCLFRLDKPEEAAAEFEKLSDHSFEFSAEAAVLLGRCQLATKKYDAATKSFKSVVTDHSDRPVCSEAAAGLLEALYSSEKYDEIVKTGGDLESKWPDGAAGERISFYVGLAKMAKGDHAGAAARFRKLADKDGPLKGKAELLAAQCLQQANDFDAASKIYQKIAASDRKDERPAALTGLAACQLLAKQPAKAAATYDKLIKEFPESPETRSAYLSRGQARFAQEKFKEAMADFEKIGEKDESADVAAYWSAKCLLRMGVNKDAAKQLQDAIKAFPESKLLAEMMYDRGVALARDKKTDQAISVLKDFGEKYPKHALMPDALDLQATLLHQSGKYADSEKICQQLLEKYPKHARVANIKFLVAENLFLQNEFEKAAKAFEEFVTAYPDDPQAGVARARMGLAYYKAGKSDQARKALSGVASNAGKDEATRPVLLALGNLAFERSEWKEARKYFQDYLKQKDAPQADDALLRIGLTFQRESNHAEAISNFDRLIKGYPKSAHRVQAMFEKGQSLNELGRRDEAAVVLAQVIETGGDSRFAPYARNHLAEIALAKGELAKSVELFELVSDVDDASLKSRAISRQSEALMGLKKYAEAQAACDKLLKLKPDEKMATEARARKAIATARLDKRDDAIEQIDAVLESAKAIDPELKGSLLYEKAWCLRGEKKLDDAAKVYDTLIEVSKSGDLHARALLELAELQADAGHNDRAAELLKQIPADSKKADGNIGEQATYRLAVSLVNLKKHAEAADALSKFIKQYSKSELIESASLLCGESYFNAARHENAIEPLEKARRSKDKKISGPATLRLGDVYAALNRWSESENTFNDYLERFADDPQAFQARFGVAWALENLGRHEQAVAAYRKVIENHQGPTAARAQFQIGECLFAKKQFEEAAAELLKVDILYAYPEWSAAALYEAGRCFEQLSRDADARKQYEVVIEKYKDSRWAKMAQDRLAQAKASNIPGRS